MSLNYSQRIDDDDDDDTQPLIEKDENDPYYTVRNDVNSQLSKIRHNYEQFNEMLHDSSVNTTSNSRFINIKKGLVRDVKNIQRVLSGLKGAVDQIERFRNKFRHILDEELNSRKQYVRATQIAIDDIKHAVDSPRVRKRYEEDAHASTPHSRSNVGAIDSLSSREQSDAFNNISGSMEMELINKQDKQLEHLGTAVSQLGHMAGSINEELKEQNQMLDTMDQDLEAAGDRMNNVMVQLSKLMKTKDKCQLYLILILICILLILGKYLLWD